jgi:alpha-beta hydrolase superfamily lysophospholipase
MYIDDFKEYVDDGSSVWNWALQDLPPLPSFIMGHSMGGCISTYLASRILGDGQGMGAQTDPSSLKGLILSAPAFEIGSSVSQVKIAAGRMINLLSPHTQASNPPSSAQPSILHRLRIHITHHAAGRRHRPLHSVTCRWRRRGLRRRPPLLRL